MDKTTEAFNVLVETRAGTMLVNRNDRYIGQSLITYGEFSEGEAALFRQLVRPGDVVVEAGANIGVHTRLLSGLVGESGAVYAFEPQRIVFQTLCANLALGQCLNVAAIQKGLGPAAGHAVLPPVDPRQVNNFGGVSLSAAEETAGMVGERVEVVPIDSLALTRCRLIKVDVEGMECEVLAGARATISRCRPLLYVENDRKERSAELIRSLMSLGYRLWWDLPPLFNPNNFAGHTEDIFGNCGSVNLFCQPVEACMGVTGMVEVLTPEDSWQAALPAV